MQFQATRYNSDNNFGNYQETEPRPVSFGTDAAGQDWSIKVSIVTYPKNRELTWQWDGNRFGDAIDDTAQIHTLVDNNRTYVLADLPRPLPLQQTHDRPGWPGSCDSAVQRHRREASTARSRRTRSANRRRTRLRSSARTVQSWRLGRHREDRRRPSDHRDHRRRRRSVRRSRHQHHDPRHRRTTLDRPRSRCCAARPDGLRRSHIGVVEQRTESRASHHHRPRAFHDSTARSDDDGACAAGAVLLGRPTAGVQPPERPVRDIQASALLAELGAYQLWATSGSTAWLSIETYSGGALGVSQSTPIEFWQARIRLPSLI